MENNLHMVRCKVFVKDKKIAAHDSPKISMRKDRSIKKVYPMFTHFSKIIKQLKEVHQQNSQNFPASNFLLIPAQIEPLSLMLT